MDGASCIAELAARVFALSFDCFDCGLQIPDIIQGVKYPDDVHSILTHAPDETFDHIVRKARVLHYILASQ